jgi:hypothetical protein
MARLSDDELSSGEWAALECSGETDPDLIPIAAFDLTGNVMILRQDNYVY